MKKIFFNTIFGAFILMAILHVLATSFYLYWDFWWFDMIVHFLGGFFVAGLLIWFFFPLNMNSKKFKATAVIVSILVIGVLWEVFEFRAGITMPRVRGYTLDTSKDIIMDVVGSLAVYFYALFLSNKMSRDITTRV